MIRDNLKIIKDFFRLVKGNKKWIFFLFFGSIMAHISSLLIPVFTSNIIYEVTNNNASATYMNIGFLTFAYIAYNFFWYLNYTAYSRNFQYSYKNLREKIIDKIFTYDNDFTDNISKGTILNTVNTDTANLSEMIDQICEIIVVFAKVLIMIYIFLKTNIFIGLIVLVLECIYLKSFDYLNVMSTKALRGQQKYRDLLTDNLSQILNGLSEIKIFNIYDKIKDDFYVLANKWSKEYMKKRKYMDVRSGLLPFVIHIGKLILYTILSFLVLSGKYEVNMLVLLITYFENIMSNTKELMGYSRQIRERSISISRIDAILNYRGTEKSMFGKEGKNDITGLVKFENVYFSYKKKNRGTIENISFTANPHEITALVGHSGSGKTTITNLLLKKYKADSGKILIDGIRFTIIKKKLILKIS